MAKRKIIEIDERKCNGCGSCIPNCPEGAIQIINNKARLVSDLCCDGLGACLGHCPQGAITIIEREAHAYDERKVMASIVRQGKDVIAAHLQHLRDHAQQEYLAQAEQYLKEQGIDLPSPAKACASSGAQGQGGCPGARMMRFERPAAAAQPASGATPSQLAQWPVQLMLVPAHAPYLNDADILIAADCVPFAYADFHRDLLQGKAVLVGCPKLDDTAVYREKLVQIFTANDVRSVTYAHMEVPCCFGLTGIIQEAIRESGKEIPFHDITISIQGERL